MVSACDAAEAGSLRDVVAAEKDADAADADEDADYLRGVVADFEEDEGDCNHHYYSPKVYELR